MQPSSRTSVTSRKRKGASDAPAQSSHCVLLSGGHQCPSALVQLWRDGAHVDVQLLAGGRLFGAHKVVVSAGSFYIRARFGEEWADSQSEMSLDQSVEVFDPQRGMWEVGPPLATARSACGSAVFDDKLYAVGGHHGSSRLSSVEVFDPQRGMWEAGPPLATARSSFGLGELDDELYVMGGSNGISSRLSSVEVFDPERGMWEAGPPLAVARSAFGFAVFDAMQVA